MRTLRQMKLYRANKSAKRGNHARVFKLNKDGVLEVSRYLFLWPKRMIITHQKVNR